MGVGVYTSSAAVVSSSVSPPWSPVTVMPWSPNTNTMLSSSTALRMDLLNNACESRVHACMFNVH